MSRLSDVLSEGHVCLPQVQVFAWYIIPATIGSKNSPKGLWMLLTWLRLRVLYFCAPAPGGGVRRCIIPGREA